MEALQTITSGLVHLPEKDIDTDQIIPARFLKVTSREDFGKWLFFDQRYDANEAPNPDFVLNQIEPQAHRVLLAGTNFGCGSSREHAAWALADFGFRVIVATAFADIFRNNALNNGMVPVTVTDDFYQALQNAKTHKDQLQLHLDLSEQTIEVLDSDLKTTFEIDPFKKQCLLARTYDDGLPLAAPSGNRSF